MSGFREAVLASGNSLSGWTGFSVFGVSQHGSLPSPFDAPAGNRLWGPQGSHPLAAIGLEELVKRSSDGLDGEITIKEPVKIGEALSGHLKLTARKNINARSAVFRLVGALLVERQGSREERDSKGNVIKSEQWTEINGSVFDDEPLIEPALPAQLTAGQTFETDFMLPAPRLGPVTAHMGSAAIVWALDAKWDVSMGGDEHVAALVNVKQNLDYLRSGAVRLDDGAMFDVYGSGDATISVKPLPPLAAGWEFEVTVNWPGAGAGRGGRLELQADVDAPNKLGSVVLFSQPVDPAAFKAGFTTKITIPADAPATLNDKGVAVHYRIRALVDRAFRSDLAVERFIAVM
ncbi:MAG: hypothetical protein QFC55_02945 [Chloroflexota bacterium]|nr:hypothetical protein [Chloroflexota bacterium]